MRLGRFAPFIHGTIQIHPFAPTRMYVSSHRRDRPTGFSYRRHDSANSTEYRITQRRIVHGATEAPNCPMICARSR
jgi:hypothetical protein